MRTTPEKPGSRDQESVIREGGREKGFCDGDLERIKAKSTSYGVQELSSASGCGSHS